MCNVSKDIHGAGRCPPASRMPYWLRPSHSAPRRVQATVESRNPPPPPHEPPWTPSIDRNGKSQPGSWEYGFWITGYARGVRTAVTVLQNYAFAFFIYQDSPAWPFRSASRLTSRFHSPAPDVTIVAFDIWKESAWYITHTSPVLQYASWRQHCLCAETESCTASIF